MYPHDPTSKSDSKFLKRIHTESRHQSIILEFPKFASQLECQSLLHNVHFTKASSDYPPSYRNNMRYVRDDNDLANNFFPRIAKLIPNILYTFSQACPINENLSTQIPCLSINPPESDHYHYSSWKFHSLNSRFRWCEYQFNQEFPCHKDGVYFPQITTNRLQSANLYLESKLTFLLYLNDNFTGGKTLFFRKIPTRDSVNFRPPNDPQFVFKSITPETGKLVIFDHNIWHSGSPINSLSTNKYILRSDLIFSRSSTNIGKSMGNLGKPASKNSNATLSSSINSSYRKQMMILTQHLGYIWSLELYPNRDKPTHLITSGRDSSWSLISLRTFKTIYRVRPHTRSVLDICVLSNGDIVSISRDRSLIIFRRSISSPFLSNSCIKDLNINSSESLLDSFAFKEQTRLNNPHSGSTILSIIHSLNPEFEFVTTGADAKILLWKTLPQLSFWPVKPGKCHTTVSPPTTDVNIVSTVSKVPICPNSKYLHSSWVWKCEFLDSKLLLSIGEDGKAIVWDTASLFSVSIMQFQEPLHSLAILNSNQLKTSDNVFYCAIGSQLGSLMILSFDSNSLILKVEQTIPFAHSLGINTLCYSNNCPRKLVSGGDDEIVKFWSISTKASNPVHGQDVNNVPFLEPLSHYSCHSNFVKSIIYVPNMDSKSDGYWLSTGYDATIQIHTQHETMEK